MTLTLYVLQSMLVFAVFVALLDMLRTVSKLRRRVEALEEWVRRGR